MNRIGFGILLFLICGLVHASDALQVENPWIRAMPPGSKMLAGYATLRNSSDAPLQVIAVESSDFASASLHETVVEDGVSKMRAMQSVQIAPGAQLQLAPGGRHLMLMGPQRELQPGDRVTVDFALQGGGNVAIRFTVRDNVP